MRQIRLYQLLVCLLCLIPVLSQAQSLTRYEYWFDDNYSAKRTGGLSGTESDIEVDIDAHSLSSGMHQLFFRVLQSDGKYSPVTTKTFFKMQTASGGLLEYWFDDNKAKSKTISGKLSSDGEAFLFVNDLDLNDVPPGVHRMYYCLVNADGTMSSPVSMTPVMLHSRNNTIDLKVASYSIAVDDGEPVVHNVLSPKSDVTIPITVDARNQSVGSHTVKTKFYNNLGALVSDNTTFQVTAQATPEITLTEENQEGAVTLSFNSIPNDVRYVVGRKDADGSRQKVYDTRYGRYPSAFRVTDFPGVGSHSYYVVGVYTNAEGKEKSVTSNEVAVNIAGAPTKKTGSIVGRVVFGDKEIDLMSAVRKIMVKFSDGDVAVRLEPNGTFYREGIPVGTTLTVSIDNDDYYTYESKEVTVTEKTRDEVLVIQATRRPSDTETAIQENSEDYDLQITSMITGIPQSFKFEVKNTTNDSWTGSIELIAAKKKDVEKWNSLTNSSASFGSVKTIHFVGTAGITNLGRGKTKSVDIAITDFPVVTEDEYYYFAIVSRKSGQSKKEYKKVACQHELASNPKEVLMERTVAGHNYSEFVEDEVNAWVIEVLNTMKKYKQYSGPLEKALEEISWELSEYERTNDAEGFFIGIPDFLKEFCEDLKNAYKDVAQYTDILNEVNSFYEKLKDIREFENADDFEKFVILSQKVIEYSEIPFAKVYSYYYEVAEEAVERIRKLMRKVVKTEIPTNLAENTLTVWVDVEGFSEQEVMGQITSIDVYYYAFYEPLTSSNRNLANHIHATFVPDKKQQHYKLNQTFYYTNMLGQEHVDNFKYKECWAEILWNCGRTSTVPLLDDAIVDYHSHGSTSNKPVLTVKYKSGSSTARDMGSKLTLVTPQNFK